MRDIDLNEYDYDLPEEKIAQYPIEERDLSKLLVYKNGEISESVFKEIHNQIPEDSLLVFNNTKVIRARLIFMKETGARIEILCLEPLDPADYSLSFKSRSNAEWKCIIGNLKKWKDGIVTASFLKGNKKYDLHARRISHEGEAWRIRFSWNSDDITFGEVIESTGHIPLPPYLNRPDEEDDILRYQTVYSQVKGSVAAPTAGLHFTKAVFNNLNSRRIEMAYLTLHVGAGTFQPVKTDNALNHEMHSEHFFAGTGTIEAVMMYPGKIIPVGTTSVRTLESLYWLGVKLWIKPETIPGELYLDQWEPYNLKTSLTLYQSLETLLNWMKNNNIMSIHAPTRIMIVPGYRFMVTNGMITNFHLPKSTLLLLISAWTGNDWKRIYSYALANNFRFLSYGDCSLLL
jgi:S-adenosylmethionine:tRNA ribosyltransferase-isomerase